MKHNIPNRKTGLSPAKLLSGRNLTLPNDPILTVEVSMNSHRVAIEAYCQTLSKLLRDKQLLERIRQDQWKSAQGEGMLKRFGIHEPLESGWIRISDLHVAI